MQISIIKLSICFFLDIFHKVTKVTFKGCLPVTVYNLTELFFCPQLYIHARMKGKWTRLVRPTIQFFLVSFSLYVGYTRVSDFKHHWSDVVVGLLQGALIAVLTVSLSAQSFHRKLLPPQLFKVKSTSPLPFCSQVRYVSDFFKQRPSPCAQAEQTEEEQLERKPSLQPSDTQQGNHYRCSTPPV